jgi:cytochrome c oxidase cbb3-type subunit II
MNALGKALLLVFVAVLQGGAWLVLWDGDAERLRTLRAVAAGVAGYDQLLSFEAPMLEAAEPAGAPLEFFDLIERDYPAAFARHFEEPTTGGLRTLYEEIRRLGSEVYVREGCFHCHTQAIREGTPDVERWGSPTRIGKADIRKEGMALTGTRRVGPDLGREAHRRSNDWHAAHLLRPRSMFPDSIMPGYPWLFEEVDGRHQPNREGMALIVYLQSLGSEESAAGLRHNGDGRR